MGKTQPKDNQLILCRGFDWSNFKCIGKFIPYKDQKQHRGSRFFKWDSICGSFMSDQEAWKDIEAWEYIPEPEIDSLVKQFGDFRKCN